VNRTDRLYAIAEELRAAGAEGRTAAWLARRFEVSTRTIKRDVSALQQAGRPIWGGGGPGGGYVLDEVANLPPISFTAGEAVAIATALATHDDLPFGTDGRSALTKVLAVMPEDGRRTAEALTTRVWVRGGESERTPAQRVIDEAVRQQVVVVIDYRDGAGESTERRPVEPMLLANTRGHWYLLAWCRRRRGGRWFRLDRIVGATLTTETFAPRDVVETFGVPPDDAHPVLEGRRR
jgi:predicted DNA-binding transcriptional regulator YafY